MVSPTLTRPCTPYLVPPAHQPGLGAGLAEEINQRHDGSLALGRSQTRQVWPSPWVNSFWGPGEGGQWRGAAGEEGTRSEGSRGGVWASPAGLGAPSPPRSQQRLWLHRLPSPGPDGPPCSRGGRQRGTCAHGGRQVSALGSKLCRGGWGCSRVCTVLCARSRSLTAVLEAALESGGAGGGC